MAKKKKRKNNNIDEKTMLYLVGGLILICIVIGTIISYKKQQKQQEITSTFSQKEIEEQENNDHIVQLKTMEERDRMEYYFSMFLEYIENENYEKAYDMLYSEFKQKYFPDLNSFEQYIQKTFPEMASIEHDNIERNGDVYVLWIYISDALNGKPGDKKAMNIVIRENNYNDVEMSFSVI